MKYNFLVGYDPANPDTWTVDSTEIPNFKYQTLFGADAHTELTELLPIAEIPADTFDMWLHHLFF